jgi:hypothetical protein
MVQSFRREQQAGLEQAGNERAEIVNQPQTQGNHALAMRIA